MFGSPRHYILTAESEGFEPSEPVRARRFSKPVLSTTQPTLHGYLIISITAETRGFEPPGDFTLHFLSKEAR